MSLAPANIRLAARVLGGSGNTFTAASASQTDVEAAIALASAGDTVRVPSGSGTWNTLTLNKAVRILGAAAWTTGTTTITLGSGNTITKQSAGVTRIRGFDFTGTGYSSGRSWVVSGDWTARPVIFEECNITLSGANFLRAASPGGVMLFKCYAEMDNDDSLLQWKDTGNLTDWKANHTIGSADSTGELNHYVEDCWFVHGNNQGTDCDDSSRVVFRYSQFDLFCLNSHGLDTSENGVRHVEIYGNILRYDSSGLLVNGVSDNMNQWIWWRGGTWVIHSNEIDRLEGTYIGSGKPDIKMDIRSQQDDSGSAYGITSPPAAWISGGQGDYPRQHQIGVGWSSANTGVNQGYVADPCYVWNNTGTGANVSGGIEVVVDAGSWGTDTPDHLQENRDYYNDGTARPSYTAYTYPHPLRESTGTAY